MKVKIYLSKLRPGISGILFTNKIYDSSSESYIFIYNVTYCILLFEYYELLELLDAIVG